MSRLSLHPSATVNDANSGYRAPTFVGRDDFLAETRVTYLTIDQYLLYASLLFFDWSLDQRLRIRIDVSVVQFHSEDIFWIKGPIKPRAHDFAKLLVRNCPNRFTL